MTDQERLKVGAGVLELVRKTLNELHEMLMTGGEKNQ